MPLIILIYFLWDRTFVMGQMSCLCDESNRYIVGCILLYLEFQCSFLNNHFNFDIKPRFIGQKHKNYQEVIDSLI